MIADVLRDPERISFWYLGETRVLVEMLVTTSLSVIVVVVFLKMAEKIGGLGGALIAAKASGQTAKGGPVRPELEDLLAPPPPPVAAWSDEFQRRVLAAMNEPPIVYFDDGAGI